MGDGPVQHDVDMVEYDRLLIEAGFEFANDLDEDETTVTFLAAPEAPANQ